MAITWTNTDLWSEVLCDIHMRAILQEMPKDLMGNICSEINYTIQISNSSVTTWLVSPQYS